MSRGLNKVMLIGHLGRDPEVRYTQSGDPVANFTLATTRKWRDRASNEMRDHTEWHTVACFGRLAETVSEFLKKGSQCYVEGELRTRSFERDGITHYRTEVHARDVYFLGGRGRDEGSYGGSRVRADDAFGSGSSSATREKGGRGTSSRGTGRSKKREDDSDDFTPDTEDDLPF